MDLPDAVGDMEITLNAARHEVCVRGRQVHVPRNPFRLLHLLLANPGRVFSRKEIVQYVWEEEAESDAAHANSIEVYVRRLREMLEEDPERPTRLINIKRVGYKFEGEEQGMPPR